MDEEKDRIIGNEIPEDIEDTAEFEKVPDANFEIEPEPLIEAGPEVSEESVPEAPTAPWERRKYVPPAHEERPTRQPEFRVRGGSYPPEPQRKGIGAMTAIAIALVFTLLGTALGIHSAYNILPGTALFENSRLGKLIAESQTKTEYIATPVVAADGLTIPEIVDMVKPAVVTVTSQVPVGASFFNPQGGTEEVIGTGFILNEEGYIATNYHVVEGSVELKVILYTGEVVDASVINYDALADLAVIRITGDIEVPGVVKLGNSDAMRVGETVVTIGNPLGKEFAGTVTAGVVSALDRTISIGNSSYQYIQIDAAINGGNSGGPLINGNGEVVGINSAKISDSTVEGIGFAIPINDLKSKLDVLSQKALYVGIAGREINAATAQQRNMPEGILILEIQDGSPAEESELEINDVITEFEGKAVKTVSELNTLRDTKKAGDQVTFKVYRNGEYVQVQVTLRERP